MDLQSPGYPFTHTKSHLAAHIEYRLATVIYLLRILTRNFLLTVSSPFRICKVCPLCNIWRQITGELTAELMHSWFPSRHSSASRHTTPVTLCRYIYTHTRMHTHLYRCCLVFIVFQSRHSRDWFHHLFIYSTWKIGLTWRNGFTWGNAPCLHCSMHDMRQGATS